MQFSTEYDKLYFKFVCEQGIRCNSKATKKHPSTMNRCCTCHILYWSVLENAIEALTRTGYAPVPTTFSASCSRPPLGIDYHSKKCSVQADLSDTPVLAFHLSGLADRLSPTSYHETVFLLLHLHRCPYNSCRRLSLCTH